MRISDWSSDVCSSDLIEDVVLDDVRLPPARVTPMEDLATRKLEGEIGRLPTSPEFPQWQRDILLSPPRYLRNMAHYGLWQESADLDEATAILGERPSDVKDADRRMKAQIGRAHV